MSNELLQHIESEFRKDDLLGGHIHEIQVVLGKPTKQSTYADTKQLDISADGLQVKSYKSLTDFLLKSNARTEVTAFMHEVATFVLDLASPAPVQQQATEPEEWVATNPLTPSPTSLLLPLWLKGGNFQPWQGPASKQMGQWFTAGVDAKDVQLISGGPFRILIELGAADISAGPQTKLMFTAAIAKEQPRHLVNRHRVHP